MIKKTPSGRIQWKDPDNMKKLKELVEAKGMDAAARYFGVKKSVAQKAYERRDGRETKPAKTITVIPTFEGDNPFEIKTDMMFTGNRGGNVNPLVIALFNQIEKLPPGDIKHSINIPITVAGTAKEAANIVLNTRRFISELEDKSKRNITITLRAVYSDTEKKNYAGTRLWRQT